MKWLMFAADQRLHSKNRKVRAITFRVGCFISGIFLFIATAGLAQDSVSKYEIAAAVQILNKARQDAGLDTVLISKDLSQGCKKHAKYLILNKNSPLTRGLNAHKEFAKLPGYSKEGEIAGKSAVIHFIKPSSAITGWLQTFYHRIPLLQPNLKEIGIASYELNDYIVTLIDCISGTNGAISKDIVYYPNKNQLDVPTTMGPEIPHPVGEDGEYGFPITVYFANWQKVTQVDFKLTDKDGKAIDCNISSPEKAATYFSQWNSICAIPKSPLMMNTQYSVGLTCYINGAKFETTYSFLTGRT